MDIRGWIIIAAIIFGVIFVIPAIVASFLRNVEAGTIRLVSWLAGGTVIYRGRSEEHTSELQSHVNLVCRLLLEKKKKTQNHHSEPDLLPAAVIDEAFVLRNSNC